MRNREDTLGALLCALLALFGIGEFIHLLTTLGFQGMSFREKYLLPFGIACYVYLLRLFLRKPNP